MGDGLEAVAELAHAPDAPTLDVLIVDAGSGDASLAMTCPPVAFLGERFLADAHAAVRPDGLLIVNCVSRSAEAFSKATQALQVSSPDANSALVSSSKERIVWMQQWIFKG